MIEKIKPILENERTKIPLDRSKDEYLVIT
jgi:hypothetical protein